MTLWFVVPVLVIAAFCCLSMVWDTHQIEATRKACARGDHRWCTEKSPWHPPGVPVSTP